MIQLIHIGKSPDELANSVAKQLLLWIDEHTQNIYHIALSGGKTPEVLFRLLAEKYAHLLPWRKVHFWWGDERMVPPDDLESNFKAAYDLLISKINIHPHNIHRIRGEADPSEEVIRYANEIRSTIPMRNQWPVFDVILLGLGEDGHTASIFPEQLDLFNDEQIAEITTQPATGQRRITLTGKVLNNAWKVVYLVSGKSKAHILNKILHHHQGAEIYPAAHIHPKGELHWFVDEACLIKKPADY